MDDEDEVADVAVEMDEEVALEVDDSLSPSFETSPNFKYLSWEPTI